MRIMRIVNISNTNFKANYFTVTKHGRFYDLDKISTDNEENLGNEPVLLSLQEYYNFQTKSVDAYETEYPMAYDGKYYTTTKDVSKGIYSYRIYYKDTGKYEYNGRAQVINPREYYEIAINEERKFHNVAMEQAIAKGQTQGLVVVNTFDIPKDVPVILVLDEVKDECDLIQKTPDNVGGIIVSNAHIGVLTHAANYIRNQLNLMSIIYDDDKYNNIKALAGKYILADNIDGTLKYHEIEPSSIHVKKPEIKKVEVPKLEHVERLLDFDELTPQNCGNKGYRLHLMQNLVKEGKLKDITIPDGFVIPQDYINKIIEYTNVEDRKEKRERKLNGVYTQEICNKLKEMNINPEYRFMVRSNFNTEDLRSFSSAGIYESFYSDGFEVMDTIREVVESQNDNLAQSVHKRYGIKKDEIQPSVIIQKNIPAKFVFTAYSDDGDGNILLELSDKEALNSFKERPAIIKINKKNKKITIEREQKPYAEFLIDENGKIVKSEYEPSKITENWETIVKCLNIMANGAEVLEEYFDYPQDIEGGIDKKGNVYFWQTRDIVAEGKSKI